MLARAEQDEGNAHKRAFYSRLARTRAKIVRSLPSPRRAAPMKARGATIGSIGSRPLLHMIGKTFTTFSSAAINPTKRRRTASTISAPSSPNAITRAKFAACRRQP
jgi:hypothetical protein